MYNRYIPQSDGSHRRRSIPDASQRPPENHPVNEGESCPPRQSPPEPDCGRNIPAPPGKPRPCAASQSGSAVSFLKNLLPRDFDTGDLMILLLLLLMAGDCQEDQNWAWLTLALYLFL